MTSSKLNGSTKTNRQNEKHKSVGMLEIRVEKIKDNLYLYISKSNRRVCIYLLHTNFESVNSETKMKFWYMHTVYLCIHGLYLNCVPTESKRLLSVLSVTRIESKVGKNVGNTKKKLK